MVLGTDNYNQYFVGICSDKDKCISLCDEKQKSDIGEFVCFNVYYIKEGEDFSLLSGGDLQERIVH